MRAPPGGTEGPASDRATVAAARATPRTPRMHAYLWLLALALVIAALLPFRTRLDTSHVTLALLLVVLFTSAYSGRALGLVSAAASFVAFNWFFMPPYGALTVADPLDWFVLLAFLGTSVVASHLLHRVQSEADDARARTAEVTTLATLGAEAMLAPRAAGALRVVAETARRVLGVATCRVHVAGDDATDVESTTAGAPSEHPADSGTAAGDPAPMQLSLALGTPVAVLAGGIVRVIADQESTLVQALLGERAVRALIPLRTGAHSIGVLDVEDSDGVTLDEAHDRLLAALAYYATLGAERARNERGTEHLESMRETDRMRTTVLASVSHDLRTPLTTIKALAHELGVLGDDRSEIIEQEADRLNRFVTDMLDMSRLVSGHFPLRIAIVPVEELVAAALQQTEGAFAGRRIDVTLPADDPLPLARFDLTQSVRIVVNLLENAYKYALGTSPLDLTVARDGARILLQVADRGQGVPPNESERIFDALYRPAASLPDVGSAGLGLAIGRGLAEAQGGTLTHTAREGGGSVFTLALPAAELSDLDAAPGGGA